MAGLVVIFGMAVVTQFCWLDFHTPNVGIQLTMSGVMYRPDNFDRLFDGWGISHRYSLDAWNPNRLLFLPHLGLNPFFPWWVILPIWCTVLTLIWRLTRRRKVGQGFPIEPTAKSE